MKNWPRLFLTPILLCLVPPGWPHQQQEMFQVKEAGQVFAPPSVSPFGESSLTSGIA
jgi:hypothetical protein